MEKADGFFFPTPLHFFDIFFLTEEAAGKIKMALRFPQDQPAWELLGAELREVLLKHCSESKSSPPSRWWCGRGY